MSGGWGGGPFGLGPWGTGDADQLRLVAAVAARENVVRLQFNTAPAFTGTLAPHDGSNPRRYSVAVVPGTVGLDGYEVRPVSPVRAQQVLLAGAAGTLVDVVVDRPFSPCGAEYTVAVNGLVTQTVVGLEPGYTSARFLGLQRLRAPDLPERAVPSRDIASPQTLSGALDPLPEVTDLVLGSYPVDDTGDYAFDEGAANLKKRILRRILTTLGAFVHLPDYGVGVPLYVKRLNVANVREQLAAKIQLQVSLEPEVLKVRCRALVRAPGLVVFQVLARTTAGAGVKVEAPFSVAA